MLIDTHCHLDAVEFSEDRDALVAAARDAGVTGVLVPSVETGNFFAVRDCCQHYAEAFPAYGLHPLFIEYAGETELVFLREWLLKTLGSLNPPLAVGEIGLDFYVPGFDAARQEFFFVEQLKIARELDLPVVMHVRRSVDQVLKSLRRIGVKGGVAHAFNGSQQQAEQLIRLGFKLGFGGAMTYPGASHIRGLAAQLPLDSIVLETDAPDIPPAWLSGRRNEPAQLLRIAQSLADLRSQPLQRVLEVTSENAVAVFNCPV